MPDIHRNARQRFTLEIGDAALHEHPLSRQIGRNIGAMRHQLVLADIERAEHRSLGGAVALAMVDRIDQHRNPEHVREQDELLPGRTCISARCGSENRSRSSHSSKVRSVLRTKSCSDFTSSCSRNLARGSGVSSKAADNGGGKFGVVELWHFCCPAGYVVLGASLYQRYRRCKHGRLEHGTVFGYQAHTRQARRLSRC